MKSNKNTIIALVVFFLAVIFLCVFVFISPQLKEIKSFSGQLSQVKGEIDAAGMLKRDLDQFESDYFKVKDNLEKMDRAFFDFESPVALIRFLEESADNSGVSSKISIQDADDPKLSSRIVQLEVKGEYASIVKLLSVLEGSFYIIKVQSLNIRETVGAGSGKVYVANFVVMAEIK